jgi:hypothetical protein
MDASENLTSSVITAGINETCERGLVILSPHRRPLRRILLVNGYGGTAVWHKIKQGLLPTHHLWGCLQLVHMGYEVALAEPISDFNPRRRPLPHDLKLLRMIAAWLKRDDIIYCAHNHLYWIPLLRSLGLVRPHIVSLLYAREHLDHARAHSGIIALTPIAAEQAAMLAPKAKIAHLGWGADLDFYPSLPYRPEFLLHCGISGRDFVTLSAAALICPEPITVITAWQLNGYHWPPNVKLVNGGSGHLHEAKKVTYQELIHDYYARSAASLIITERNLVKDHAFGFTNLIEAMALAQPIIHTRSGALADEIDVEQQGCGLSVPAQDAAALAAAMTSIMRDPERAAQMGRTARILCESCYNISRYSVDLHNFFSTL